MMVSYCPFELSVSKLQRFFSQGIDHTSGITNRVRHLSITYYAS